MTRVGLLVCDHVDPELREIAGDYPDMFRDLFAAHPEVTLTDYDLTEDRFPASATEQDAWITTGSRHSVYEPIGWIGGLADLVREIAASGRRYVGVCFGHQMIAHALGGKVERSPAGWGVGLKTVEVRDRPWWLDVDRYRVLNSHADQVMDLPPGGRALGGNDHCEVSLMALGDDIVGIQGHPEFQPAYVRALIERRRGGVIPDDVCDAAEESLGSAPDNRLLAEGLVRFLTGG